MLEKSILVALIALAITTAFGALGQRLEITLQKIHQDPAETVVDLEEKKNPFFDI